MKLTSYWLDTAAPAGDFRRAELPERVDVAVVGAGLTGLSTALHVARQGASVALLEQNTVGWGASGRNGGMATTGLAIGFRKAIERYGKDRAAQMYQEYDRAIGTVEDLVRDEDIDCDFKRTGKMNLACKPGHYEGMEKTAAALAEIGTEVTLVPRSRLREEIGSDYYHGAMVDAKGAGVHVGKLCAGLATASVRHGATIHENAGVSGLRRLSGRQHVVQTSRGALRADQVVIGTSGYTGKLTPWLRRRIVPVGSFIIVTEPLSEAVIDDLLPNRRMASDSKNLLYYFRITPDSRLLFGGRARFAISSPDSDIKSGRILRDGLLSVFPQLERTRIDYCWGGLVDLSLDQMVHAGERDGVLYSVGYSGHGVQMATHMGSVMADMVAGNPSTNVWKELDFRPMPGHFGPPWFLPPAGAWFKLLDLVT